MRVAAPPLLALDGLRRVYHMGEHAVEALKGADLTIDEGEFVAIVGPSGSGKSTLMYLLGCLDTPSAGSLRVRGHEAAHLDDAGLSRLRNREIGYVFQQFFLLPDLDVVENVALPLTYAGAPRTERRAVARAMLELVGLGDRLDHTPNQLSGGQMQRVAIARALAADPHLILADEPTGNLDSHTSTEIMRLLRALHAAGKTVVLITHDHEVAAQADRTITLVDGAITDDRCADAAPPGEPVQLPHRHVQRGGRLALRDLGRMALREGILAHKLRSSLTMLGIVFGIAAVISMTAITEGGKRQQLEALRQIGLNTIQVRAAELPAASLMRERRRNPHGVTRRDLDALRTHVDGIVAAGAWKSLLCELRRGDVVVENVPTLGVTGDFQTVTNYRIAHGRFLDRADAERYRRVCVLGPAVADGLELDPTAAVGQVIIVGDQPFTVVGIMQRKAFSASDIADIGIPDRNQEVYLPLPTLRRYFPTDPEASALDVLAFTMDDAESLLPRSRLMRHIVADLHRGAEDFTVSVPLEKLKQAQQTKEVFNVIIIVIAGMALIVGGIGIMNIMLATVTERTREIGIRRAIGATRRGIMAQFLAEALLLSGFGGILGLAIGIAAGQLVRAVFAFPVAYSPAIMIVAVAVSAGVGVIFGLYPAWLAANKDPVEALRV